MIQPKRSNDVDFGNDLRRANEAFSGAKTSRVESWVEQRRNLRRSGAIHGSSRVQSVVRTGRIMSEKWSNHESNERNLESDRVKL